MIAYSKQDFCVTLFPNELNEDALYTAQARVLQQFHNKFVSELGAFVIVTEVAVLKEPFVQEHTGNVQIAAECEVLLFLAPFCGQVMDVVVVEVMQRGLECESGYMKVFVHQSELKGFALVEIGNVSAYVSSPHLIEKGTVLRVRTIASCTTADEILVNASLEQCN